MSPSPPTNDVPSANNPVTSQTAPAAPTSPGPPISTPLPFDPTSTPSQLAPIHVQPRPTDPAPYSAPAAPAHQRRRRSATTTAQQRPRTASVVQDLFETMPTAAVTTPSTTRPQAVVGTPDVERSASLASAFGGGSGFAGGRARSYTVSVTMPARQASGDDRRVPKRQASHGVELGQGRFASPSSSRRRRGTGSEGDWAESKAQTRARRGSSPVGYEVGEEGRQHELSDEMVGVLDCVDPQVATMNHLQNMTNSVMFPYLPSVWSRRPDIRLSPDSSDESLAPLQPSQDNVHPVAPATRFRSASTSSRRGSLSLGRLITGRGRQEDEEGVVKSAPPGVSWEGAHPLAIPEEEPQPGVKEAPPMDDSALDTATSKTTTQPPTALSKPSQSHSSLSLSSQVDSLDLSQEQDAADHARIDRHIHHLLSSSQKQKLRLALKGLWAFVKTPMGFVTAIYGFLVVFWGAAIVLFLLGWIDVGGGDKQSVWVEISSQVVNGLFTVTGVGLIPWRSLDTYRMGVIWTLKRRGERRRDKLGLPPIDDPNDLPDPRTIPGYIHVLNEQEYAKLAHHQEKFALSQTWYKPHATATHRAFPIRWALWNTILMDLNSVFQCILCGCMWGMRWRQRPAWTTGCLIPLSFLCGIGASLLIFLGSKRTKKEIILSQKLRQALGVPLAIAQPSTLDPNDPLVLNGIPASEKKEERLGDVRGRARDGGAIVGEGGGGDGWERERERGRRETVTFGAKGGKGEKEKEDHRHRGLTLPSSFHPHSGYAHLSSLPEDTKVEVESPMVMTPSSGAGGGIGEGEKRQGSGLVTVREGGDEKDLPGVGV
ncbi:hypothetical protein L202_03910 [Cryptococcus amylolentus CBS 6039]|uniref:Uncharacterized protein n=1 Tax=Cryptococcus amylolentus CBS 6039 TaxID=1295533 RepID=A0A1E3HS38_9TREE|nr:hypothetical protein L202_03910 [Cryptococcus amylolentus CBS 6039]ODN78261.1 hypothetical protein L202_03910 [Cryptococcus amylolentus CBS 6039]